MALETSAENRVRSRCRWETYERLLEENAEAGAPRFTFDRGWLEIMSPSLEHERINEALRHLVSALADHLALDLLGTGSTTFRRRDLQQGFEADASYYVRNAAAMRGVQVLDLAIHPPPELVVEIDISRSSHSKLELYRSAGVEEVWRWFGHGLFIFALGDTGFQETTHSRVFPGAGAVALSELVAESGRRTRVEWNRLIRTWLEGL